MSTSEESLNNQDPDYVSTTSNDQTQQNIFEENARNNTAAKIRAIVEKEFSQEIDSKEKEILQIQERLQEALKIFHLLRYVIITNFYNRKQCQNLQTTETTKQTRIHPAIKSLLGKYPKSVKLIDSAVPSTSTDPKFLYNDESFASSSKISTNDTCKSEKNADEDDAQSASQSTKRKFSDEEDRPRKVPRYVPPKSNLPEKTSPSRGNSHKVRKRVIIGNISKWIPPDWREDAFSHKWTMYVRGDKDNSTDISNFVTKVRFFLHPSYRPNDVIEVASYPFHLSRRGWGEFPLRVQLHFKNPRNKPVDIIHHLKLDRTYTGLQTLGSETLVDVWIHTMEPRTFEQTSSSESVESSANYSVKTEPSDGNSSEQLVESAGTSNLTANTVDESQMKKKIIDSEVREQAGLSLNLIKKSKDVRMKAESDDATANILNDENELGEVHYSIMHDHGYFKTRYFDSRRRTVKEGNITIAHFADNDVANISQTLNSDVQSSNSCQSLADLNSVEDNLQIASANTANDSQKNQKKSTLFDAHKSLQAKNLKCSDTSVISKDTPSKDTLLNGFYKPSITSLDRLNNLQNFSNPCSMKPLQISIPPSNVFASPNNKHVLLFQNKKSIPVDVTSILSSSENSKRLDSDLKAVILKNDVKQNVRISQGVSILKKPPNSKANAQQDNKKTVVLTLNSTNSLLLNVNENVPILKIVDSRDLQYGYSHAEATKDVVASKQEVTKSINKSLVQRPRVTLGKDKYKIHSKRELYEAVLQSIDTANIADTEALIRFIARRLPLVTRDARDPEYRQLHPYACTSEEEYFAQNVGKQRAVEWSRAKIIRCFLQKRPILADQLWSIKEILIWTRLHGYTPTQNAFGMLQTAISDAKKLPDSATSTSAILTSCTEPIALQKWLQTFQRNSSHQTDSDIEEIDVENEDRKAATDRKRNNDDRSDDCSTTLVPLELDESLLPLHNFVCDTARDIGIRIVPEEIVPGVLYNATSRVMMRVVECFVEDLIRSSLAKTWERSSGNKCPTVVTLDDVRKALMSREEFDIFTNEGLGSGLQLSSTELSNL